MKASPKTLVARHYRTLVDQRTGKTQRREVALQYGLPILLAVALVGLQVELPAGAAGGLLTTTGLLSAFFFGVVLQVAEKTLDWSAERPKQSHGTTWQANFMEEISASAGYASLVSILAACLFVVTLITTGWLCVVASGIALGLTLHLVILLSMVIARVFALTQLRLGDIRTGNDLENVTPISDRKARKQTKQR